MVLARVVGPIWGARHAASLTGHKVLELVTAQGQVLCAVDALGAGPGEWVLVAHGSRVRDLTVGAELAEKDIVVAIVDGIQDSDGADSMKLSSQSAGFIPGAARGAS
jgi:microcompartment protein CcmK/EutM